MKVRAIALAAGLMAAHSASQAWFIFIPTGAIQSAMYGNHCISATARVGDKIKLDNSGREWLVKETNGTSYRCNNPAFPIIAKLEPYLTEAELRAEQTVCLPMGAAAGNKTVVSGMGEVYIKSIDPSGCSDHSKPISARVVRAEYAMTPPTPAATPEPPAAAVPQKSPADRLRELKQLRDENLITQEVYEAKQREILAGQ